MIFVEKPRRVQAIKWNGTSSAREALSMSFSCSFPGDAFGYALIYVGERILTAQLDSWVMRDAQGNIDVLCDSTFKELYAPAEEDQG